MGLPPARRALTQGRASPAPGELPGRATGDDYATVTSHARSDQRDAGGLRIDELPMFPEDQATPAEFIEAST